MDHQISRSFVDSGRREMALWAYGPEYTSVDCRDSRRRTMRTSLSDLGEELLTEIFRHLELWELITCELVSKQWRTCAQQPSLWSSLDFSNCPHPELVTSEVVLRLIRRGIDFDLHGRIIVALDLSACRYAASCIIPNYLENLPFVTTSRLCVRI